MKKIALFSMFGFLLSMASLVSADTSIKHPSTFTLKVGESAYIANYQNMKIEFVSIDSTSAPMNDPLPGSTSLRNYALINVSTEGGCGPASDPRCLGMPSYENNFALGEGESVDVLALKIRVTKIGSGIATFSVSSVNDGGVVVPLPPPILPLPPTPTPGVYNYPATFTLKVGQKATIANYQNIQIEFLSVDELSAPMSTTVSNSQDKPSIYTNISPRKYAVVRVSSKGGCIPNADERCLGLPPYDSKLIIGEGESVDVMGLKIKAKNITNTTASFTVSLSSNEGSGTTGGSGPSGSGWVEPGNPGTTEGSEKIIVCPNGEESENCSVCSGGRCVPVTANRSATKTPGVLRLEKGETVVSAEKASTTEVSTNLFEVKTKRKARLLFVIPVSGEFVYSVDNKTGSSTVISRPWWSFLAW